MQGDAPVSGDHQSGQGEAGQRGRQGCQHPARAGEDTGGEQEGSSRQEEGEEEEKEGRAQSRETVQSSRRRG